MWGWDDPGMGRGGLAEVGPKRCHIPGWCTVSFFPSEKDTEASPTDVLGPVQLLLVPLTQLGVVVTALLSGTSPQVSLRTRNGSGTRFTLGLGPSWACSSETPSWGRPWTHEG